MIQQNLQFLKQIQCAKLSTPSPPECDNFCTDMVAGGARAWGWLACCEGLGLGWANHQMRRLDQRRSVVDTSGTPVFSAGPCLAATLNNLICSTKYWLRDETCYLLMVVTLSSGGADFSVLLVRVWPLCFLTERKALKDKLTSYSVQQNQL